MPHKGSFSARWVAGLSTVGWPLAPYYHFQSGQTIDTARNIMVSKCLQLGCKFLFFLDDDVILRADTLNMLYDAHLPVVSGAYRSRGDPYEVVAQIADKPVDIKLMGKNNIMEVEYVGSGCLLIERRILERMGQKLDQFLCMTSHKHDAGQEVLTYSYKEAAANNFSCPRCGNTVVAKYFDYRLGKFRNTAISEDFFFCHQLKNLLNIPLFVHMAACVDHEITENMFVNETGIINRTVGATDIR